MSAGYYGTQKFRPGITLRFGVWNPNNQTASAYAATTESRLRSFFTTSRLASWLKTGTFAGYSQRCDLKLIFQNENTTPSGDLSDPDNAAYRWDLHDAIIGLSVFDPGDLGLQLGIGFSFGEGRAPNWMVNSGYAFTNSNGAEQLNVCLGHAIGDECRGKIKDIISAFFARYGTASARFWKFSISECLFGGSSAWPAGFTRAAQNRGYADILNHIITASGGIITPSMGSNTGQEVNPYCIRTPFFGNPDPKIGSSSCSLDVSDPSWPNCSAGTARRFLQDGFTDGTILTGQAYEANGMDQYTVPAGLYANIDNPFGYNGSTPAHKTTAIEAIWWHSSEGVMPISEHEFFLYEHGGDPAMTTNAVVAALDAYMASGSDIIPALPAGYDSTPPSGGGGGTWTHVADGTGSTAGSPGQPAGKSVGDLLILATVVRTGSETPNTPSGWTPIGATTAITVYGRYATGDSGDTLSSADLWSGTASNWAIISAFTGGGQPDLSEIVVAVGYGSGGSGSADIISPALTVSTDGCIIYAVGRKSKTTTSNGATLTSPSGLSNRVGSSWGSGTVVGAVADYEIQTTATNLSASIWDMSVEENALNTSIALAFKSADASSDITAPTVPGTVGSDTVTQTSFRITHNNSTDAVGVAGYRYWTTGDSWSTQTLIAERTQAQKTTDGGYVWSGLIAANAYKFKVSAFDAAGNESALSGEGTRTTSTPADSAAPVGCSLTSVTFDEDTRDLTFIWDQGVDAVTAAANITYNIYGTTDGSINYSTDKIVSFTGDLTGVQFDADQAGITAGNWTFGVRAQDVVPNEDTNTTTQTVTIVALSSVTIGGFDNGSGSPQTGDVYIFTAVDGDPFPPIDIARPHLTGTLITLESDGTYLLAGYPGRYQGILIDSDPSTDSEDIWIAQFEATIP